VPTPVNYFAQEPEAGDAPYFGGQVSIIAPGFLSTSPCRDLIDHDTDGENTVCRDISKHQVRDEMLLVELNFFMLGTILQSASQR
jgi:hypothetical protein